MDIKKKLANAPSSCGVYIFRDKAGGALYVGKAASLKKRLRNYIRPQSARQRKLLKDASKLEIIKTASPEEALILEANLIKEEKPRYNIAFRDDKTYPYIKITYPEEFPRIVVTRVFKPDGSLWLGPYARTQNLKDALKFIRGVFPYRTCRKMPRKSCLEYTLSLCPGPCVGRVKAKEYRKNIDDIVLFLEGKKDKLIKSLSRRMKQYAREKKFEKAALLRDRLAALTGLTRRGPTNALLELARVLKIKNPPGRIEAFDVSNISGKDAVGSMVVFRAGRPERSGYRRFKIKFVREVDDYRMIKEIVHRRYQRLLKERRALPDLVIIDGGSGHLKVARRALGELGLGKVPAISIAKRFEEIFLPGEKLPIRLDKKSTALNLIRSIRDEAHRFALQFHRLRRRKTRGKSRLDEIPGIGPRRRKDLLRHFDSVERISRAGVDELCSVGSVNRRAAEAIVDYFTGK